MPIQTVWGRNHCESIFEDVYVPEGMMVLQENERSNLIRKLWPIAVVGKCCEMLGAMQAVFEMTIDYAKKREQFDRPLSAFQVIQHYCADMAISLECSRCITNQASSRISKGIESRKEASMAKAWSSDSLKEITAMSHQIHGAFGYTKDSNIHLFFRYAKAAEAAFGDAIHHKKVVAEIMDFEAK